MLNFDSGSHVLPALSVLEQSIAEQTKHSYHDCSTLPCTLTMEMTMEKDVDEEIDVVGRWTFGHGPKVW